jgi:hypothetical protein
MNEEDSTARLHAIYTLPNDRFEAQYLRDSSRWDCLTSDQLEHLLARSLLHYGMASDTSLIASMSALMRRILRDLSPDRRAAVYAAVSRTLEEHKSPAFYALIPVLVHEPEAEVAATATIDFVSMSPITGNGKPAGLLEAVALVENGAPNSPGGVFGGLVSLGDERFRSELDKTKAHLSPADVQAAARCESGFATDAQIRFWLDWAEELMPLSNDPGAISMIGSAAAALGRIRKRALIPTVFRFERLFPACQHGRPARILESWNLGEYAALIAPRLYALEEDEPPLKVFSCVLEIWGLPPRARKCDRFPQTLVS